MLKVGMNVLLWTDCFSLSKDKALFEKVIDMGFDGIEVPVFAGMTVPEAAEIGEFLAKRGVPCSAIGIIPGDAANPISPNIDERNATFDVMKLHIDCAKALGADVLCGPYTQGLGYFTGERLTKQEWDWSIENIGRGCEYAGTQGIKVAIEPLNRFEQYVLNTVQDGVKFVKEINMPHIGLLLDTMHMNIEELSVAAAFEYALPYTNHIHISENNRGIPGSGHACGADVFAAIKKSGYSGWLTIEAFNEGAPSLQGPLHIWRAFAPSDDELARQGLAYIRTML